MLEWDLLRLTPTRGGGWGVMEAIKWQGFLSAQIEHSQIISFEA